MSKLSLFRNWFCVGSVPLFLLMATGVVATEPKVLTIGIDGLRSDAFTRAQTPHLDALAERGVVYLPTRVTSETVIESDTVSGPGWTTFLTGTWADRHGVKDNSFRGRNATDAPHGFRLAKLGRPELRTASFLCWTPLAEHVTTDADIDLVVTPETGSDVVATWTAADLSLTLAAEPILRSDDVDWTFVYLGQVDECGHTHGFHPSVAPYVAAIENVDRLVGKLVAAVSQRETIEQEDWLFIVGSDHGGQGTGHGGGRENPMVFTAPMIVSGEAASQDRPMQRGEEELPPATVDIVAVALTHLQIPIQDQWQLAGRTTGWLAESPR